MKVPAMNVRRDSVVPWAPAWLVKSSAQARALLGWAPRHPSFGDIVDSTEAAGKLLILHLKSRREVRLSAAMIETC